MPKFSAALILAIISSQAYAEWTITPYSSGGDGTFYWDVKSAKYHGSHLKIWITDDFGEAQISTFKPGEKFLSIKEELELTCANSDSKYRVIDYSEHSGHFDSGTIIFHDKQEDEWNNIEPNDLSYHVMTAFCKKPRSAPR